jgi:hypothetical protein
MSATAQVLSGDEPEPSRELSAGPESAGIADPSHDRGGDHAGVRNVNNVIVYAANGYVLKNTVQGAGSTTVVTTPTPIWSDCSTLAATPRRSARSSNWEISPDAKGDSDNLP